MTMKTLGEALMSAIVQGMIDGETAAATASQPKRTPTEAGAEFQEVRLPSAKEVYAGRWEYTATKAGAPHSEAVYCHLAVIEGGRRAPEGGGQAPAGLRDQALKVRRRETGLRVVHSAASR